ncbi:MAG: hypothetical protein GQ525_08780 [Draconibacterium sp.]|nr:hypothetical protein [Draconibacterium sp.]
MKIKINKILWGYAFLIVGLAYFFGLFIDLTGDSGLYAAISRQMVESGDWFNLSINGEPYDQKPHLFFWLAGFGIKLFGNNNFAFKLFPFLYGLLGIYFTYRLGKQIFSNKVGKLAALIAGTSQISFLYFFDFHTDTVLQTGVVLALWQLAAYLQKKKVENFVLGFLGIGLAMLSKGPIGAILAFFAVLLFLLGKKDFRQLFHPKWILGILIVLIVISPSLIHLYNSFGFEGLKFYFITNNIGRITGEYAGSSSDPFFYLHTLLWAVLPWTIFVAGAIVFEIKSWVIKKENNIWGVYLLGSVLIFVLILSIAKGKAPNYFFIAIPAVSVVTASWAAHFTEISKRMQMFFIRSQIIIISLLGLLFIFLAIVFVLDAVWLPIAIFVFSTSAIFIGVKTQLEKKNISFLVSVIIIGSLNLLLNTKVFPDLYKYQGARQVLEIFEKNAEKGDRLYNFELEEYEMFFYAKDSVNEIEDWNELREVIIKPGTWIYTNSTKQKDFIKMKFEFDAVYEIPQRGMNRINLKFLNPQTRKNSLKSNYLFVTSKKEKEII